MGVQGLWRLVESTGRPVNLESLEGKVLAVDVSIWLNQAVLGVHGSGITNPHLQVLFNRICKLLFYRIKPIFVFDGVPPQLKKQTLAARRERKNLAASKTEKTTERIVQNYLKSHAIQAVIGDNGEGASKDLPPLHIPRKNETDLYELPPLPTDDLDLPEEDRSSSEDEEEENIVVAMAAHQAEMASTYQDLGEVDIESESFRSMPVEVQHELISEIQESSKKNSWARMHQLPKESQEFSHYQMKKLLNKSKLSLRLDDLRKEMRSKLSLTMKALLDAENESSQVDAGRVASEDKQHYILMKKGKKVEEESEESEDEMVIESYAERAGFATSMDLKLAKAVRKRGAASSLGETSSKHGIEVVLDDESLPARKKMKGDGIIEEMGDKESKDEVIKIELRKFFHQLDSNISPAKNTADSRAESKVEEDGLEQGSLSKPDALSEPSQKLHSTKPESFREAVVERMLPVDDPHPNVDQLSETSPKGHSVRLELVKDSVGERTSADFVADELLSSVNISSEPLSKPRTLYSKPVKNSAGKRTLAIDHSLPKSGEDFSERELKCESLNMELSHPISEDHHPQEVVKEVEGQETIMVYDEESPDTFNARDRSMPLQRNDRTIECPTKEKLVNIESNATMRSVEVTGIEKSDDTVTIKRLDILKELRKKKENISERNSGTAEVITSVVGPGTAAVVPERMPKNGGSSTQRLDILKELQKKKADMENMLKAFESRMDDFRVPEIPSVDYSADQAEYEVDGTNGVEMVLNGTVSPSLDTSIERTPLLDSQTDLISAFDVRESTKTVACSVKGSITTTDANMVAENRVDTANDTKSISEVDRSAENPTNVVRDIQSGDETTRTVGGANQTTEKDPGKRVVVEITLDRPIEFPSSAQNQAVSDDDGRGVYLNDVIVEKMQESDQEPEIDEWQGLHNMDKISELEKKLQAERKALEKERRKEQKKSSTITDTMYADSKELLQCFGIPFIESPQEAEAQCAYLDLTDQTEGTITDDSDIWLFGGARVFRHFFSKKKDPEFFRIGDIERHLLLNRKKLINLAYLVGSDYTLGIQGVGSVGAMEIMGEFKGQGLSTLKAFKSWWTKAVDQVLPSGTNAIRSKWCKLVLPDEFPNPLISKAYMKPVIDDSSEEFQWGSPDLGLLRDFARERFGWMKTKVDEHLLPVLKRLNEKQIQSKVTSFFGVAQQGKRKKITSKRMRNALMQMERSSSSEEEDDSEVEEERPKKKKRISIESGKKRVRRKKKVGESTTEGGKEKKDVPRRKRRVKRKKVLPVNGESQNAVEVPEGVSSTDAQKTIVVEVDESVAKSIEALQRREQSGKAEIVGEESRGRQRRNVPSVDYAAMLEEEDEDIPDEVLLDVAEDVEMAALMDEAGSGGHSVTHNLRSIGSSQPRSFNRSVDVDFVDGSRGKGPRGGGKGRAIPRLNHGGRRGKGKRGGGVNKGKSLIKKKPDQLEGPQLSCSGTDSD